MPVGRPTDDGEIVQGSRHGSHKGGLGAVTVWDCPACGMKNEGRRPEGGCAHCGSGDPTKGKAGQLREVGISAADETSLKRSPRTPAVPLDRAGAPLPSVVLPAAATKIYRLIEYVITDPGAGAEVLRRSLIGRLTFPWGAITGAIVDTLDGTQEDRLRMARMQPGVWVGNTAASVTDRSGPPTPATIAQVKALMDNGLTHYEEAAIAEHYRTKETPMELPDTGPAFTSEQARFAHALYDLAESITPGRGYAFVHTLALALSNVSVELDGNMEPEKFMPSAAALQLANALMQLIPEDWNPQPEGETDGGITAP